MPVASLDNTAAQAVEDWKGYNELSKDLALISNINALNAIDMLDELAENSNLMALKIPEELDKPAILQQINKVDSEINSFYANVNRSETKESVIENHIQTVVKAFDTLNRELNRCL